MRQILSTTLATTLAFAACGGEPLPATPPPPAPPARPASRVAESTAAPPSADAPEQPPPPAVEQPQLPAVELVPATPAAPPVPMPTLGIVAPTANQVIPTAKAAAFQVKLRVQGSRLEPGGDHLCIHVDKHPCVRVTDLQKPLTLKEIDPTLDDGQHVLTVIARRSSGESVKPVAKRAAFASLSFYVGKKVAPVWKDGGPMLFFDSPGDGPAPPEGVLLDFYVANAEIARGKYVVHASVGGPGLGLGTAVVIDSLTPWRLRNARPGDYVVRLSLHGYRAALGESSSSTTVSFASVQVPGAFSEVTRSFRVTAAPPSPGR